MKTQDGKKSDYIYVFAINPESESARFKLHKHELCPCIPSLNFYYITNGIKNEVDIGRHFKYDIMIESEDAEAYYGKIGAEGYICIAPGTPFPIDRQTELNGFFQ